MPLGQPAVTPLRDRGEVAYRIDAIRQRLGALDAEVTRLASVADAGSSAQQIVALQRTAQQLAVRVTALESALGVTDTFTLAASEAITKHQLVVPAGPNQCQVADPSDPRARVAILGFALNAASAGQQVTIQRRGQLTLETSALETGRPVFLGLAGTYTQDPSYASSAAVVAMAMSSSVVWVSPHQPVLLTPTHYADVFDDAMPVSWGKVAPYIRMLEQLLAGPNGYVVVIGHSLESTGTITGLP